MKKIIPSILILLVISVFSSAKEKNNVIYQSKDLPIFSNYIHEFYTQRDESIGTLIVRTGQFFSGNPYVASTLENTDQEELVVNLTEFDCTTFLETCFALSLMLKDNEFNIEKEAIDNFDIFCHKLKKIRYRDGRIKGYTSRLHYFSDWIFCNEKKGFVQDISKAIGGDRKKIEVNFMSTHPTSYSHLKKDATLVEAIKGIEKAINQRTSYCYVPKLRIRSIQSAIHDGDIIAFTTSIEGLDVSHVGFAIRGEKDELYLLHASTAEQKVVVSKQPLSIYTGNIKRHTGIMVARPL